MRGAVVGSLLLLPTLVVVAVATTVEGVEVSYWPGQIFRLLFHLQTYGLLLGALRDCVVSGACGRCWLSAAYGCAAAAFWFNLALEDGRLHDVALALLVSTACLATIGGRPAAARLPALASYAAFVLIAAAAGHGAWSAPWVDAGSLLHRAQRLWQLCGAAVLFFGMSSSATLQVARRVSRPKHWRERCASVNRTDKTITLAVATDLSGAAGYLGMCIWWLPLLRLFDSTALHNLVYRPLLMGFFPAYVVTLGCGFDAHMRARGGARLWLSRGLWPLFACLVLSILWNGWAQREHTAEPIPCEARREGAWRGAPGAWRHPLDYQHISHPLIIAPLAAMLHIQLHLGFGSGYFEAIGVPRWARSAATPYLVLLHALNAFRCADEWLGGVWPSLWDASCALVWGAGLRIWGGVPDLIWGTYTPLCAFLKCAGVTACAPALEYTTFAVTNEDPDQMLELG